VPLQGNDDTTGGGVFVVTGGYNGF
jgi:hypothetical protein